MKLFRMCAATVAALMMSISAADAGLLGKLFKGGDCGAAKSCGCADTCQPSCCKPTIARPCETKVYVYQRQCSNIKPPCCDECCAPETCCAPAAKACTAPGACAPGAGCAPGTGACAPACNAPAACAPACNAPAACAPAGKECCAPSACAPAGKDCCAPAANACGNGDNNGCCNSAAKDCGAPCAKDCGAPAECCEQPCCDVDPCEVAKLIYQSQTCCYAKDRCKAIHKLGKCSCICSPEIMCAFVYALNDTDERVRREAAEQIGCQIKKHGCCCSPEVVAALTCALGDCDKCVRKLAEKALCCCGYEIVDGCCDTCGDACGADCAPGAAAETAGELHPVAPPAPPTTDATTFKSRLNIKSAQTKSKLANLFGLAR